MAEVFVRNSCRCAVRNAVAEQQSFDTKEEAKEEAQALLQQMQATFCKKHQFVLQEYFGGYEIIIKGR